MKTPGKMIEKERERCLKKIIEFKNRTKLLLGVFDPLWMSSEMVCTVVTRNVMYLSVQKSTSIMSVFVSVSVG